MKILKPQLQMAIGAGKYLILLYRIQNMNPQILHAPGELTTTPIAPPVTRSRARLEFQENPPV
jgi:hypothetical protein